jgi:hypothetical protein
MQDPKVIQDQPELPGEWDYKEHKDHQGHKDPQVLQVFQVTLVAKE